MPDVSVSLFFPVYNDEATVRTVQDEVITHLSLVARTLEQCLDAGLGAARLRAVLVGGGPVPPALVDRARAAGVSVSVVALWLGNFLLSLTFPVMVERLGVARCFWVYAGICLAGFLFILVRLPETRGKTLEQIEKELVD
jgi:hypothetical protein